MKAESIATARGDENVPTSRTQQQQPSKGRGDGWNGFLEGSQGCRAEYILGLCPQNRNTHLTGRLDRLLQASKDAEFVREARPQLAAYIKDKDSIILANVNLLREQWVRWFNTLLNAKSPKLDPNIAEGLG